MNESIITYGGYALTYGVGGPALTVTAPAIPPLTYRFRFESPQTAASLTGVGARGSWNRISDYIWDFTCNSHNPWSRNFHYDESAQLPACHLVGASTTAMDVLHQTFYGQDNIKSVYIQEAQLTQAFQGCDGITSFQMEDYAGGDSHIELDSAETIEFGVFHGTHVVAPSCTSLHIGTLTETNYNSENFSVVGSRYNPCTIVVDSMPNAVSIATMCQGCDGISSIYLGHTDSLENCQHAFAYCTNLTQVHIDDMSNVTSTYRMFDGCVSLETCPAFDLSSCTDMSYMFDQCTALTACPDFTIDPAVLGGHSQAVVHMYQGCIGLNSGAFDWYYKLSGDTGAYVDVYGHLPPDPAYHGPFDPSSEIYTFEGAYSDEVGWEYIPDNWK